MSDGGNVSIQVQGDDSGGHHLKLLVVLRHLVDRGIRPLNGQLHEVFDVCSVHVMAKSFIEHLNRGLRSNFSCLSPAYAVSYCEYSAFDIGQEGIFIQRPPFIETAIRKRRTMDYDGFLVFAHCTASNLSEEVGLTVGLSAITLSRALRFEKAINIPNIAKLVIKLNPPWLTNGSVIPVIGSARKIPPTFTRA